MVFFSILIVLTILTSGCIFQTENSQPIAATPPTISSVPSINSGRTSIGIAFNIEEISTSSLKSKGAVHQRTDLSDAIWPI